MNFWRECTGSRKLSLPLSGRRGGRRGGFFLWKIFHRLATTPIGASNWLLNKQRDTWLTSTDCFLAERERIGPRLGHPVVSRARTEPRGGNLQLHALEPSYGITLAIYSLLSAKVARERDIESDFEATIFLRDNLHRDLFLRAINSFRRTLLSMKSVIFCSTIERSSRISASSTLCVWYVLNIPSYLTRWNSIMGGKNKFQRKFAENFPRLDRSKMWLRKSAKIYAPVSTNDNLETNSGYFPSEQTSWSKCYCNCFCKSILNISKIHRRGNLKKKNTKESKTILDSPANLFASC